MGFQVVLLRGTSTRVSWEASDGESRIAIGTQSEWALHDPGITANHVELYSDGKRLLVYAHAPDVMVEQTRMGPQWTEVSEGVLTVAGTAFRIVRLTEPVSPPSTHPAGPSRPAPPRSQSPSRRDPTPLGPPRDPPSRETVLNPTASQPSIRPRLGAKAIDDASPESRFRKATEATYATPLHSERNDATHISLHNDSSQSHPKVAMPTPAHAPIQGTGKFAPPPREPGMRPTTIALLAATLLASAWVIFGGRGNGAAPATQPQPTATTSTATAVATAEPALVASEAQTAEAATLDENQAALALVHGKVVVAALAYERIASTTTEPAYRRLAQILKRRVRCANGGNSGASCP